MTAPNQYELVLFDSNGEVQDVFPGDGHEETAPGHLKVRDGDSVYNVQIPVGVRYEVRDRATLSAETIIAEAIYPGGNNAENSRYIATDLREAKMLLNQRLEVTTLAEVIEESRKKFEAEGGRVVTREVSAEHIAAAIIAEYTGERDTESP